MSNRLFISIVWLISLVPAYGSSIVVRPRNDGDNTVREDGTSGNAFNDTDLFLFSQPRRQQQNGEWRNERRALLEFDVFDMEDPFSTINVNTWMPGDNRITRALLKLHVDSDASTRGIGTYEVWGYRARNNLRPRDSADEPNRRHVGGFTTSLQIDDYVTVELDTAWLNRIWNRDINRLRPGFQIRATEGAPNRLAIDAYNYDCLCDPDAPLPNDAEGAILQLTFAPAEVPEPATYGMMLLGLGAITLGARHGRRGSSSRPHSE